MDQAEIIREVTYTNIRKMKSRYKACVHAGCGDWWRKQKACYVIEPWTTHGKPIYLCRDHLHEYVQYIFELYRIVAVMIDGEYEPKKKRRRFNISRNPDTS